MSEIIALVNSEEISKQMIESALARYLIQLEEDETLEFEPTEKNIQFLKTEVLNQLIERKLLLQRAKKAGIEVSHEAVRENIEKMKANFKDAEEWQTNLISLHIQEENLFDEVKKEMLIEKFLNENYPKGVKFTEEELKAYYDEHEKFMKDPDLFSFYEAYAPKTENVKEIYETFQQKSDAHKISQEMEKSTFRFHHHIDVPAFQLPEQVLNVLAELEIGKIASMESPEGGFLVYKLLNKLIGKRLVYDNIKEKLAEYLIQSAKNEVVDKIIQEEMEKAAIDYKDTTYLEK
jgi:hypothetical protein